MSVVTGVVLCMSVCEEDGSQGEDGPPALLEQINAWLAGRSAHFRLPDITESAGGGKHPQMYIAAAGFNYFPEDDFAAFVMALPWLNPENAVLVMEPEEGETRVFRPTDTIRLAALEAREKAK
jgi:hypothetical protein